MLLPEKCYCVLFYTKDDSFILPDCTSIAFKSHKIFKWKGIDYNKISFVGVPLTPNIYLEIRGGDDFGVKDNIVYFPDKEGINPI